MLIKDIHRMLICLMVLFSAYADAGLFGPSNYEECILAKMKGVTSDVAARAVTEACYNKFPGNSPPIDINKVHEEIEREKILSTGQVQNIKNEGVSWTSNGTGLMIKLYNGNDLLIQRIVYRYRINDGKREGVWSNKQSWKFGNGHGSFEQSFGPDFGPYSYMTIRLVNRPVPTRHL